VAGLTAPRALAPLRHRRFRLLTAGQVTSNVGDACYAVALPWYVLADHGSAVLLGTVLAAYGIPRTALLAVGGYASDRWRPQTVMMAADIGLGGESEVALPALAHGPLHAGAAGYGAILAAFGAGALLGTLTAGQLRRARRPAIAGSLAFLAEAVCTGVAPYFGSTAATARRPSSCWRLSPWPSPSSRRSPRKPSAWTLRGDPVAGY
jgi:MFS family permease